MHRLPPITLGVLTLASAALRIRVPQRRHRTNLNAGVTVNSCMRSAVGAAYGQATFLAWKESAELGFLLFAALAFLLVNTQE
jgi:hypothetical protein